MFILLTDMLQTESLQRSFLSAYAEIDIHKRGYITHGDLNKFAENAGLPDSFVEVIIPPSSYFVILSLILLEVDRTVRS